VDAALWDTERLRGRLQLFRSLGTAGPAALGGLITLNLTRCLLPAASATLMAVLVSHVEHAAQPWWPLAAFLAVLLVGHLVDAFSQPLQSLVRSRIDGAHRAEVARLTSASDTIAALEDPDVQDLVKLASADPENWTEKTPGDGAVAQLGLVFRWVGAIGAGLVLASYAWWLLLILLVPAIAARIHGARFMIGFATLWVRGQRASRVAGTWRDSLLSSSGGKEQRAYGFGEWAIARQVAGVHTMFDPLWERRRPNQRRGWAITAGMALPLATVYAIVAVGVAHGHASVAVLTAVLAAGWAVFGAIGGYYDAMEINNSLKVVGALPQLRAALASAAPAEPAATAAPAVSASPSRSTAAGRAGTPASAQQASTPTAAQQASAPRGRPDGTPPHVELRGVRFAYPGTDRVVLDGLDLTIKPGELLAIVGLNGAGKSTLIKILAGLYRPDAGQIRVDGADVNALGPQRWRERISVVFQDFVRYHLSAADNVALGQAGAPRDEAAILAAAHEAGLTDLVDGLPDGWDTALARDRTDGVDLSGGQWQHVVLARALYAVHTGAGLLILDEPTAHLDVRSEQQLFDRLLGRRGRTSIVLISHRLSTVRQADRIVLLDGGRITESGTHDELMALGGGYARMFTTQAERFRRGYDDRIDEEDGQ
jgi:ABC-type multidrug transport system fused ATPase/permease subunit